MSNLTDQQTKVASNQSDANLSAQTTLGMNVSHTGFENTVISDQSKLDFIARELDPSGLPTRHRARIDQRRLANNPAVLINGLPPQRGIPSNAKQVGEGYFLTSDGTVIPKP